MSARNTYIVCYDIAHEKRLRQVFKICKNHGTHLQFSVFECDLNEQEKIQLQRELTAVVKADEDQVLFIQIGPAAGRGARVIHSIGLPYSKFDAPCYVV
jgi:CRISPR-associated protein Cas2